MNKKPSDIELLEYLASHEVKDTAAHFGMTPNALRGWLFRLRLRIVNHQEFLNRVRNLQKSSQRIRKLTTISKIATVGKIEKEEEEF